MGLFSKTPPPVLPERPDLNDALGALGERDRTAFTDNTDRLGEFLVKALDSPWIVEAQIVALIPANIARQVGSEERGPLILTPEHLVYYHRSLEGALNVPLRQVWNLQEADQWISVDFGHGSGYNFGFGYNDKSSVELFKNQVRMAVSAAQNGGTRTHSDADELEKLAALRDRGVLTEEEFQGKKAQILGL